MNNKVSHVLVVVVIAFFISVRRPIVRRHITNKLEQCRQLLWGERFNNFTSLFHFIILTCQAAINLIILEVNVFSSNSCQLLKYIHTIVDEK